MPTRVALLVSPSSPRPKTSTSRTPSSWTSSRSKRVRCFGQHSLSTRALFFVAILGLEVARHATQSHDDQERLWSRYDLRNWLLRFFFAWISQRLSFGFWLLCKVVYLCCWMAILIHSFSVAFCCLEIVQLDLNRSLYTHLASPSCDHMSHCLSLQGRTRV